MLGSVFHRWWRCRAFFKLCVVPLILHTSLNVLALLSRSWIVAVSFCCDWGCVILVVIIKTLSLSFLVVDKDAYFWGCAGVGAPMRPRPFGLSGTPHCPVHRVSIPVVEFWFVHELGIYVPYRLFLCAPRHICL